MSNGVCISFDAYYSRNEYNKFLENIKTNNVEFIEYVLLRPPYHFYFKISEKHLPVFLKYDILPKNMERFLLEKLKPVMPSDEIYLRRKPGDSALKFEKFVSPRIFRKLVTQQYGILFRYSNRSQLLEISRDTGATIWMLGKHREWNLAFSFSKYIKGYIPLDWVFVEKKKLTQFNKPGEFEYYLNWKKLVTTKLSNKTIDYPYIKDGQYHPLKMPT